MSNLKFHWNIASVLALALHFAGAVTVDFYEHSGFEGEKLHLDVAKCTNLREEWKDRISSVNTNGNCIKVFKDGDCGGNSAEVAPGTPSHNHLHAIGFGDSIKSVDTCSGGGEPDPDPEDDSDWQQDGLKLHNEYRQKHNAQPLSLDADAQRSAQKCADYLASLKKMEHICNRHPYGENLGSGIGERRSAAREFSKGWYSEVSKHDFNNNNFQYESGHFSQVVWKNSQKIGFGFAKNGDFNVLVAHYYPSGNYQGQFLENVERAS